MCNAINWLFVRHGRALSLVMAGGALLLVVLAVIMTHLWNLSACYMCMFQRVLYLGIMLALLIAFWRWSDRKILPLMLVIASLVSLWGFGLAGYQSWLQWFPQLDFNCGVGSQNFMEKTVDWLGQLMPSMFMATGLCEDDSFKIFWLSLAVWSALSYLALSVGCVGLLWARCKNPSSMAMEGNKA